MLIIIFAITLFAGVYSNPSENDVEKIMRHFMKSQDVKGVKTKIEQNIHPYYTKLSSGSLNEEILKDLVKVGEEEEKTGCKCVGYNCGCCLHLKIPTINLDDEVCANFSYLPAPEYGVSVTLTVDKKTIFNETVSVRNPPALCAEIPYLKKFASLCLKFKNLSYSNSTFSGCVYIVAKLEGFKIDEIKIGCFKIPPKNDTIKPLANTDFQQVLAQNLDGVTGLEGQYKYRENPKLLFRPIQNLKSNHLQKNSLK